MKFVSGGVCCPLHVHLNFVAFENDPCCCKEVHKAITKLRTNSRACQLCLFKGWQACQNIESQWIRTNVICCKSNVKKKYLAKIVTCWHFPNYRSISSHAIEFPSCDCSVPLPHLCAIIYWTLQMFHLDGQGASHLCLRLETSSNCSGCWWYDLPHSLQHCLPELNLCMWIGCEPPSRGFKALVSSYENAFVFFDFEVKSPKCGWTNDCVPFQFFR